MSDAPAEQVYIDEQLVHLRREVEETRKFVAEQHKLMAEGDKFRRERMFMPIALAITAMGAGAALFAGAVAFVRLMS